jgi:hypothetical protein
MNNGGASVSWTYSAIKGENFEMIARVLEPVATVPSRIDYKNIAG